MERTPENTQKLIKFYTLYNRINTCDTRDLKQVDIDEEYVWNRFKKVVGDGTMKDFIKSYIIQEEYFVPYLQDNFSFLKKYPRNVQEFLLKQILLDSYPIHKGLYNLHYTHSLTNKTKYTRPKDEREHLHKLLTNIDDFIMVCEFFDNPSYPLIALNKIEDDPDISPIPQIKVDKILAEINDNQQQTEIKHYIHPYGC